MWQNVVLRKPVIIAVCVVGLTGCNSAGVQTPTLSEPYGGYIPSYTATDVKDAFPHPELYKHPLPINLRADITEAQTLKDPAFKKAKRNHVQDLLMVRSDQICTAYQTRLIHAFVTGNAAVKIGESLLKLVLSPLTLASTTFTAASGSIVGSLSNEVLQHAQFQAVNKQIIERRDAIRVDIHKNQKSAITDYSVSRAIYDAELYHSICNYATQYAVGAPKPVAESDKKPSAPATPATKVPPATSLKAS